MKFINNRDHTIYISEEKMFVTPEAITKLEKKIGFKYGLIPYKYKLQKKYNKEGNN